jgi:uncharacterized YccA/Bax inhibitor family protein
LPAYSCTGEKIVQTNNPAFQGDIFTDWAIADRRATTMTVQGTAVKTLVLLAVLSGTFAWSWNQAGRGVPIMPLLLGSMAAGAVVGWVTIFWRNLAVYTAPVYAALQGAFLGTFSHVVSTRYQGIAFQAIALTLTTLFCMLVLYGTRAVRVTEKFRAGVIAATGAVVLFYLGSMLLSLFGMNQGVALIQSSSLLGIGISLVVVGLAAFNLLLDFDYIERNASAGAPKTLEWYGAFGLIVTLVWLYLEILRLLRKLQDR